MLKIYILKLIYILILTVLMVFNYNILYFKFKNKKFN